MKLSVQGYKSIAGKITIDVNGLTILSGANSSGKSSFMQPFLLIKQTIESHLESKSILLDGPNVKLSDTSEIISRVPGKSVKLLRIEMETKKGEVYKAEFKPSENGLVIKKVSLKDDEFSKSFSLTPKMKAEKIVSQFKDNDFTLFESLLSKLDKAKWEVKHDKCFLEAVVVSSVRSFSPGIDPSGYMQYICKNIIHVPGLRGNPERNYKHAKTQGTFPGSFEQYVASIIHSWKLEKDKRKFKKLIDYLKTLELASFLDPARINETRLELKISRNKNSTDINNDDCVNIADVGFGVSQTLPVLVALLIAKKDQVVYIEQPELHLHPKAQYLLSKIIADAVNNDVKVIIETHSSLLIRGIQSLVAEKVINRNKISLHWFTQSKDTGETFVDRAVFDEIGAFGEWPVDFDDVSLDADSKYLHAVEEALSKHE